jgi:tyrosine-protein phosphatase YwqE
MHSHFIPGIDDGAKTIEDSVNLITAMHDFGYTKIITTPHIMGDNYRNTPEIILSGLKNVKKAVAEKGIKIELEAASEYYIDYDFEKKIEKEPLLTFGKNYVLVEVSYLNAPENLYKIIFQMQLKGYKVVLAHPERYNYWHDNFEMYENFIDRNVYLQVNINSLTGYYSQETKKIAEELINKNMISFIGSDCHRKDHIEVIKKAVYEKHFEKLLSSGKLLNNTL